MNRLGIISEIEDRFKQYVYMEEPYPEDLHYMEGFISALVFVGKISRKVFIEYLRKLEDYGLNDIREDN